MYMYTCDRLPTKSNNFENVKLNYYRVPVPWTVTVWLTYGKAVSHATQTDV